MPGQSKRSRRANPYADAPDDELEAAYREAIEGYADRVGYFESLPGWMFHDFKKIHERGPAAYGLTGGEWRQFYTDRARHMAEGLRLGEIASERRRRLMEAARAEVASCPTLDAARAAMERRAPVLGPGRPWRMADGGDVREFVMRGEQSADESAAWRGAAAGYADACLADFERRVEALAHGEGGD